MSKSTNSGSILIAPSILSADFARLGDEIKSIDVAGADYIHVDVMDGHFVPNITIGPMIVKAIRPLTKKIIDVHLMITPADPYLKDFADAGADIITVHIEAGPHIHRSLQTIKSLGKRAGVVVNPSTPIENIKHVMDLVDMVLIMTVNPGFGGQSFIPLLDKIQIARKMIDAEAARTGRHIDLEIDGGITKDTAPLVAAAGANVLVAGTAVFKHASNNYKTAIDELRNAAINNKGA